MMQYVSCSMIGLGQQFVSVLDKHRSLRGAQNNIECMWKMFVHAYSIGASPFCRVANGKHALESCEVSDPHSEILRNSPICSCSCSL
jgi:hypothetical protein